MKRFLIFIILFSIYQNGQTAKYVRDLPTPELQKALTSENFPNMDAVIVLKEQSFQIHPSEVNYRGITFIGPSTTFAKVLIVKLFNEAAVERYGSFEFTYFEFFGDEIPHLFEAKVRVLKTNGKTKEMSKKEIQKKVTKESSNGEPIMRSVLFKVPDLQVGDILQIEYSFVQRFSQTASEVFYYNDRDFTLFSNLYVTFPRKAKVEFLSFPKEQIGEPKVSAVSEKFGAGDTYFWSMRNLKGIPKEPFSFPFSSQSLMTAFSVKSWEMNDDAEGDWVSLAQNFYKHNIDKDKIKKDQIAGLGFSEINSDSIITFEIIDSLYTRLRKNFVLVSQNSLYPASENIKSIFEKSKGDASDLAYIMFKILEKWNVDANLTWLRDQRDGTFEKSVPTLEWFDRLAVLVNIRGIEKLYDFDRCIPNNFYTPWFLRPADVVVIKEKGFDHKTINRAAQMLENTHLERHELKFNDDFSLSEQLQLIYKGKPAERIRGNLYGLEPDDIKNEFETQVKDQCLSVIDSVSWNDFFDEPTLSVTLCGKSGVTAEQIDNFLTFKLRNQCFNDFKNEIFSTIRYSHVNLGTPFQIYIEWEIELPAGYAVKGNLPDRKLNGPGSSVSEIKFKSDAKNLNISLRAAFPEHLINRTNFINLMQFLEKTQEGINQDLVLEKI